MLLPATRRRDWFPTNIVDVVLKAPLKTETTTSTDRTPSTNTFRKERCETYILEALDILDFQT